MTQVSAPLSSETHSRCVSMCCQDSVRAATVSSRYMTRCSSSFMVFAGTKTMSCPGGDRVSGSSARTTWAAPNVNQNANAAAAATAAEGLTKGDFIVVFMWYSS